MAFPYLLVDASVRDREPLKVTFPGGQFFPGLERQNKVISMIKAHVG
jgi:hypothetical protein